MGTGKVVKMKTKSDMFYYKSSGLSNVYLKNGFEVHDTPYGEGVSIHNIEGLHRVIGLDIVKSAARLNGEQVRFLRKELDLAQKVLAQTFDVTEDTIRNWEHNRTEISSTADLVLRQLYIEYVDGDGKLRELVETIAKLDRADYQVRLELEETPDGWRTAIAA